MYYLKIRIVDERFCKMVLIDLTTSSEPNEDLPFS